MIEFDQIENEGENLSDYGLQDPSIKIDIKSSIGKISLQFGNNTRNGQGIYMLPIYDKVKPKDIWVVNSSLKDAADIDKMDWLKKEFIGIPIYDVHSFSITTNADNTLLKTEFDRLEDSNWQMSAPIRYKADEKALRMFLSRLMSTRIDSFVNDEFEEKFARSALERPVIKLRVETKTKRVELILGNDLVNKNGSDYYPAKLIGNEILFMLKKTHVYHK